MQNQEQASSGVPQGSVFCLVLFSSLEDEMKCMLAKVGDNTELSQIVDAVLEDRIMIQENLDNLILQ